MLIIVPFIIIFLLVSYLVVNDTTIYEQYTIYTLILGIVGISFYTYKFIQNNIKQQEKNEIQIEINNLIIQMENTKDEQHLKSIQHKIDVLKNEQNKL